MVHGLISVAVSFLVLHWQAGVGLDQPRTADVGGPGWNPDVCDVAIHASGIPAASHCDSAQKLRSHDAIRLRVKTVASSMGPCEWHSITAGPLVLLSHLSFALSLWETALSFPYEIAPSFLLEVDSVIFFFNSFLIFPPLRKKKNRISLSLRRVGVRREVQAADKTRWVLQTSWDEGVPFRQAEIKLLSFGLEKIDRKMPSCMLKISMFLLEKVRRWFFFFFPFTLLTIYGGWARGLGGRSHPPSGRTVTPTACAVGARLHALDVICFSFLLCALPYST